MKSDLKLATFSWVLYDFANTIFSINIVAVYFSLWIVVTNNCREVYYSFALGVSLILSAFLMPVLGEISDTLKRKMPFLVIFTITCALLTTVLGITKNVPLSLFIFIVANLSYHLAEVMYDSLLPQISDFQSLGRTSGLGICMGYLGGGVGVSLVWPFFTRSGIQAVFIPTGVFFLLFSIPASILIKDLPYPYIPRVELGIKNIFKRLCRDIRLIRQIPGLFRFLTALFLCLCGIYAIIMHMSVYSKAVLHLEGSSLIYLISISLIFAMAGAYISGFFLNRLGSRNVLNFVMKIWCFTFFLAATGIFWWILWIIVPLSGICLGATRNCARVMLVEIVPREKIGQMFGFLGLIGSFAAILGPMIWWVVTSLFAGLGSFKYRLAVIFVLFFMYAGYRVFQKVEDPRKVVS